MSLTRQVLLMALSLVLNGCMSNPTEMNKNAYTDLLVGPYSILLPTDALRGVTIMGSERNGISLAFDRRDKELQRWISISAFYNPEFGYEIDMRKFPRLVLKLEKLTPELGLSDVALEDIENTWRATVKGRRTKVLKIPGGQAYLVMDDKNRQIMAHLTADNNARALNLITTFGISEEQLQELILDNLYLNGPPPEK
ncbi:hypothetical protein [Pseudomonas sp. Q1-7]|uniref:hypothetical protein n=1 Tax=Pseudomonas sp. Q1-7 TaxID=3020843 RepID=UPI002300458E|nr:hypothetical protein [Pseudomonas sp. Q1-7]